MTRLGFVTIDGYPFAVYTDDPPPSPRAPGPPSVERAGTPQHPGASA